MRAWRNHPTPPGLPERRRVLSVIHGPVFGGGANQLLQLRDPLATLGWETIAVAPDAPGNVRSRYLSAGVPTVTMPLHRLRATADPRAHLTLIKRFRGEVGTLRRVIRTLDIDVVQAHGDTNPHAAVAGRLEGRGVVWELYDTRTPPPLRRLTMPLVLGLSDVITTWGEALAKAHPGAKSIGDRQITVFPPVDPDRFRPDGAGRRSARRDLGVGDDEILVGAVGNRNPSKGYEYLAEALARVIATNLSARGCVLGASSPVHSSYERSLRARINSLNLSARMHLRDPNDRVAQLMRAFDMLVVSSVPRSEGIPTVILEAMATGLPVVSTRVGAIDEVVEEGETGLLVPAVNPEALANAILRLAGDPDLRARLGAAGRARILERYGLEQCAERHARAYERALMRVNR